MTFIDKIPPSFLKISSFLSKNHIEPYLVGGFVRDALLGVAAHDYDIAVNASPQHIMKICHPFYPCIPTGLGHGTVTVLVDNTPLQITSFRKDIACDGRHADVVWEASIEEDAVRRDFTINALYMDSQGNIYDPTTKGLEDLKASHVRFIGDTHTRIMEDHLRILRYYRFRARFEPFMEKDTDKKILAHCAFYLKKISKERIVAEIDKLLQEPFAFNMLKEMDEVGVLQALRLHYPFIPYHIFNDLSLYGKWAVLLMKDTTARQSFLFSKKRRGHVQDVHRFLTDPKAFKIYEAYASGSIELVRDYLTLFFMHKSNNGFSLPSYPPPFPLSAKELMHQGYSGPQLGERLKELRKKWYEKGYKTSLND
jgi:poly(A) polymerase